MLSLCCAVPSVGGSGTSWHLDGMLPHLRFGYDETPKLVHRLDKVLHLTLLIHCTALRNGAVLSCAVRCSQECSGVLLLARTRHAASLCAQLFRRSTAGSAGSEQLQKCYWSVSVGCARVAHGRIDAPLVSMQGAGGRTEGVKLARCMGGVWPVWG